VVSGGGKLCDRNYTEGARLTGRMVLGHGEGDSTVEGAMVVDSCLRTRRCSLPSAITGYN
jgi:hypothetical protein